MISPSDAMKTNMDTVPSLLPEGLRTGSVLPLEFEAIDSPKRRKSPIPDRDAEPDALTKRLREEMAALDVRFHAQTQQVIQQLDDARSQARNEARQEWQRELEERIAQEREQVMRVCADFSRDREKYFAAIEAEVVQLALAIAARVLHREARLDPLLLGAAVRVALEKVAEDSGAVLHVPEEDVQAWQSLLSEKAGAAVQVVGEQGMGAAECVLETSVGRVEFGVSAQLQEIEKGFFDLLQQRPA